MIFNFFQMMDRSRNDGRHFTYQIFSLLICDSTSSKTLKVNFLRLLASVYTLSLGILVENTIIFGLNVRQVDIVLCTDKMWAQPKGLVTGQPSGHQVPLTKIMVCVDHLLCFSGNYSISRALLRFLSHNILESDSLYSPDFFILQQI